MPLFAVDSFVSEYVSRHATRVTQLASSAQARRWSQLLAVVVAALGAVMAQPHWLAHVCAVLTALVAAKLLRFEAAIGGLLAGILIHWFWHGSATLQLVTDPGTLKWVGLGILGGGVVGLVVRLIHKGHAQAQRVEQLRQLSGLWSQIDGACLKEVSIEGKLLAMNEPGRRVMEVCDFDAMRGKDWLAFWVDDSAGPARSAFQTALSGRPARFSGFCPTARGTPKWWDVLLVPVMTGKQVISVLSLSWDVTERTTSRRLLAQAHDEMASLLDNLKDGFFQLTADWRLARINGAAIRMLQLSESRSLGMDFRTLLPEGLPAELRSALEDGMHERIVRHAEIWFAPSQAWYRIDVYPRDGGVTVLFSDVSDDVLRLQHSQAAEARLRMSQELGHFADWQYDLATRQMTLSSQAVALTELSEAAHGCHGSGLMNQMNPQDRLSFVAAMLDMSEGKVDFDQVVRIETASESDAFRYLRMAGYLLVTKRHPAGLVVGCMQDITPQKRREQQLVDAEAFSRNIIDAMPLYVGVLDQLGQLVAANLSWREFPAKDAPLWAAEGTNYLDKCREAAQSGVDVASQLIEAIEAVAEGLSASVRIDYKAAGWAGTHYVISVAPIIDGSRGILVMFEDVSERIRMEAELTLQAQRLELAHAGSDE